MNDKKNSPAHDDHFANEVDETLSALERSHEPQAEKKEPKKKPRRDEPAAEHEKKQTKPAPKKHPSLVDDDQAFKTQHSAKETAYEAHVSAQKKKNPLVALGIAVGVLAVLFVGLSVLSVVMYQKYSPERFISQVMTAVEQQDSKALAALLVSDTLTVNEENAALLCQAFSTENAQKALSEQLNEQVLDPTLPGAYEALQVQKDPVFFGFSEYHLKALGVSLLLRTDAQNVLMSLNGTTRTGELTENGVLYNNLFPGRYTCSVTGSSALGQALEGESTVLDLFIVSKPLTFDGALPIYDITVSGIPDDSSNIFVNGTKVEQKPSGGTVSLPQVTVGSTITMEYTAPHGAVTSSSVIFQDPSVTELTFTDFQTQGGTPDEAGINLLLNTYYSSLLNAANQKDASQIGGVNETMRAAAAQQITTEPFTGKTLQFTNAAVNFGSVQITEVNGLPGFVCTTAVAYSYTLPEDSTSSITAIMYEACEFVFENNTWVLNRTAVIDEPRFTAGDVSALTTPAAPAADSTASSSAASSAASSAPAA